MNRHYPLVSGRAAHRCEYCRAPEAIFNFPFEVEHVVPVSQGGIEDESNFAPACRSCDIHKANHLSGFDENTQNDAQLFNPRLDRWEDHSLFDTETGEILGRTEIGRATVARLQMNSGTQLAARIQWTRLGLFP